MKYSEQFEKLLEQAFAPDVAPHEKLNDQIRELSKERNAMKRKTMKKAVFIPLAAILVLLVSIVSFAAWNLLNPSKVAKEAEDEALAKAFESDDAMILNDTQIDGGYQITLLGLVSGKGISDFAGQELDSKRTYAIVAIGREDGSPMPETIDDEYGKVSFFVSPLVKGIAPWQFNIYHMEGGYVEIVKEGILYRIIDCDSIEMFADRGLELCVIGNTFSYDVDAFTYDEQTGEITPKEDYPDTNVVFNLPISVEKANPEEAAKYLESVFSEEQKNVGEEESQMEDIDMPEEIEDEEQLMKLTEQGTEIPGSLKELQVSEKGYVHYEFDSDEFGGISGDYQPELLFPDENVNIRNINMGCGTDNDGNEVRIVLQLRRDENGVITGRMIIF